MMRPNGGIVWTKERRNYTTLNYTLSNKVIDLIHLDDSRSLISFQSCFYFHLVFLQDGN